MADYIDAGDLIEIAPEAYLQQGYDYLGTVFPGWSPSVGGLSVAQMEAWAQWAASVGDQARDVPTSIFRYFGGLVGIQPIDAIAATGTIRVPALPGASGTMLAGTNLTIGGIPFSVTVDTPVATGSFALAPVAAIDPGVDSNITNSTLPVLLTDSFSGTTWIDQATLQTSGLTGSAVLPSGGQDAEDDPTYLGRLSTELQLLSPRLILPRDFEAYARNFIPGGRFLALDGYNPADDTYNNERMIALAAINSVGADLSSDDKTALDTALQAEREINFIVNVIDPTESIVNVTFSGKCYPPFTPSEVLTNVYAALNAYLSRESSGVPPYGDRLGWLLTRFVRYSEISEVINRVDGFWYLDSLQIGLSTGSLGTVDLELDGAVPIVTAGALSGVVTAP